MRAHRINPDRHPSPCAGPERQRRYRVLKKMVANDVELSKAEEYEHENFLPEVYAPTSSRNRRSAGRLANHSMTKTRPSSTASLIVFAVEVRQTVR